MLKENIRTIIIFICTILFAQSTMNPANSVTNNIHCRSTVADTIFLWNGKNLDGLNLILQKKNPETGMPYKIENNVLHFFGNQTGYFRTKEKFSNYKLYVKWRWPEQNENGNSGVLIHIQLPDSVWPKCFQVQFKKDNAGDIIAMNGAVIQESIGKPKETALKYNPSNEKPEGEWNSCEIICRDDSILVYINNLLQNKGTKCNFSNGTIGFQLEGKSIEFRKIYVIKLD